MSRSGAAPSPSASSGSASLRSRVSISSDVHGSPAPPPPPPQALPSLAVGTRIALHRPGQDPPYRTGVLVNRRDGDCWRVAFEAEEAGGAGATAAPDAPQWVLLAAGAVRVLPPRGSASAAAHERRRARLAGAAVGGRVRVYWEPYRRWFAGTIRRIEPGQLESHLIEYDEKGATWEDLLSEEFVLIGDDDNGEVAADVAPPLPVAAAGAAPVKAEAALAPPPPPAAAVDPRQITTGIRVSVYLKDQNHPDREGAFYDGTVAVGMRSHGRLKNFATVRFDDGDVLLIRMIDAIFKVLPAPGASRKRKQTSRQDRGGTKRRRTVQPRTSQNRSESKVRPKGAQRTSQTPSKSKARPQSAQRASRNIKRMEPRKIARGAGKVAEGIQAAATHMAPSSDGSSLAPGPATGPPDRCPLCKTDKMLQPRALDCCHLFCRECIRCFFQETPRESRACPVCQTSYSSGRSMHLYKCRREWSDVFRAVVREDQTTGARATFSSASAATQAFLAPMSARLIVDACRSTSREGNLFQNYLWSFCDDSAAPAASAFIDLSVAASTCKPQRRGAKKPVERLCARTGKVLDTYESVIHAAKCLKMDRKTVSRAASGVGNQTGNVILRFHGEHGPSLKRAPRPMASAGEPTGSKNGFPKPVERLCIKTGKFLESYRSITVAAKALRVTPHLISRAACGEIESAVGYFFRFEGSSRMPSLHTGVLQIKSGNSQDNVCNEPSETSEKRVQTVLRGDSASLDDRTIPIERLCVKTGTVLATYGSSNIASRKLDIKNIV